MNQDEIHNLLLLLLLIGNNNAGTDDGTQTQVGAINDIILAAMLLRSCNNTNSNDSCNRCPNIDTTF